MKKYMDAFTLVEVCIVASILAIVFSISIPNYITLVKRQQLQAELQSLKQFFTVAREEINSTNQTWLLLVSSNHHQKKWCINIQPQDQARCDCLLQNCNNYVYQPKFIQHSMLTSAKYFPEEVSIMNGLRMSQWSFCLQLIVQQPFLQQRYKLSFANFNTIKIIALMQNEALSICGSLE